VKEAKETKQTKLTDERARELTEKVIFPDSDNEMITAFTGLLFAVAHEADEGRRLDLAYTAMEAAYRRGSEFGRVLYAFEQHAYAAAGMPS
jgi:hypothetical protein